MKYFLILPISCWTKFLISTTDVLSFSDTVSWWSVSTNQQTLSPSLKIFCEIVWIENFQFLSFDPQRGQLQGQQSSSKWWTIFETFCFEKHFLTNNKQSASRQTLFIMRRRRWGIKTRRKESSFCTISTSVCYNTILNDLTRKKLQNKNGEDNLFIEVTNFNPKWRIFFNILYRCGVLMVWQLMCLVYNNITS